jgi:predicted membrane-bound spermidine synthase
LTAVTALPLWTETLYSSYGQSFRVDEILFEEKTAQQHLMIFRNEQFGRVLALDGIVQTTERDEFIYAKDKLVEAIDDRIDITKRQFTGKRTEK